MGWQINASPFQLGTQFEQVIGSQNLLFSYLAWRFYSWNFRGEKYRTAPWIRAQQNQTCNPAWSMGQGEGEFVFLVPDNIPTKAVGRHLYDDCTVREQKLLWWSILHVCEWSVCVFILPLRIVLRTPWWQNVYLEVEAWVLLILRKDAERNRAWKSLNAESLGTLRSWYSKEFEEGVQIIIFSFSSSSLFRPLQLSCVYMVWFGTQNTTATEKRYFIRKPVFVLYQS